MNSQRIYGSASDVCVCLITLPQSFAREQILGEDQRPLVVKKGKKVEEDHPKREVPPDAPIIDVSRCRPVSVH